MIRLPLPGGRRIGVRVRAMRQPVLSVLVNADGEAQVEGTMPREDVPVYLEQLAAAMRERLATEALAATAEGRVN